MSETIAENPTTYNAKATNSIHCLGLCYQNLFRSSYDVTDNKTNEMYRQHWFPEQPEDKYQREDERLKSYENWPLEFLDKRELAQTGLYYTGEDDKVKCYFCEVEIGRWEAEDQPINEHLRFSPNCPLLRRRTTNNVPINNDTFNNVLPPHSYDVCGNGEVENEYEPTESAAVVPSAESSSRTTTATESSVAYHLDSRAASMPAHNNASNNSLASNGACSSNREIQMCRPEYPEFAIEAARFRSFAEWPRNMKQRPKQLADAGFFYTGIGDRVKCFSCGCGLKDWDDDDEPWEQHALWMPKCQYLNLLKGPNFIENVAAKFKANNGKTLAAETEESATTANCTNVQQMSAAHDDASARLCTTITAPAEKECSTPTIADEKLCKICFASEYNTAFSPCGHVVACAKCASSVTKCPVCRVPIIGVMRVFFP